ncbi:MAG: hypothetical protein IJS31_03665, partial [Oscillospiraceae bacterium]|nr:hypothetical protein [Oscillospiraceae bacterium]
AGYAASGMTFRIFRLWRLALRGAAPQRKMLMFEPHRFSRPSFRQKEKASLRMPFLFGGDKRDMPQAA